MPHTISWRTVDTTHGNFSKIRSLSGRVCCVSATCSLIFTCDHVHGVTYDVHSVTHDVHSVTHDVHSVTHDVHSVTHDVHSVTHDVHSVTHDVHSVTHDVHSVTHDVHSVTHGELTTASARFSKTFCCHQLMARPTNRRETHVR